MKLSTKQENITPFEGAFRKDHKGCVLSPRSDMCVGCAELSVLAKSLMTFLRLLLLRFPFLPLILLNSLFQKFLMQ